MRLRRPEMLTSTSRAGGAGGGTLEERRKGGDGAPSVLGRGRSLLRRSRPEARERPISAASIITLNLARSGHNLCDPLYVRLASVSEKASRLMGEEGVGWEDAHPLTGSEPTNQSAEAC
jgi:hypothetical protein